MDTNAAKALGIDGPGVYQLSTSDGKVWTFDAPTQGDKAEYALWCKQQTLAGLRQLQPLMSPFEFSSWQRSAMIDMGAKAFDWGAGMGEGVASYLQTGDGLVKLLELCLRRRQPWATRDDILRLIELAEGEIQLAVRECLTVPLSESPDGSPSTQTGTALPTSR